MTPEQAMDAFAGPRPVTPPAAGEWIRHEWLHERSRRWEASTGWHRATGDLKAWRSGRRRVDVIAACGVQMTVESWRYGLQIGRVERREGQPPDACRRCSGEAREVAARRRSLAVLPGGRA